MGEALSQKKYKITKIFFSGFFRFLAGLLNQVFKFFSLKKTKRFWGIVYDSVSKQPLDPVIVKLLYTDGREIETCVTDIAGRYGFLAKPGKFKIFVRKTNYIFPSKYSPGETDGVYTNLYHGEFFELSEDSEVVAPNIPMDPATFDWNQQAKKDFINAYPYWTLFLKKLVAVVFWFGLVVCFIALKIFYPHSTRLYIALGAYTFLIVFSQIISEVRLWGEVIIKNNSLKPESLFLELYTAKFPGVSFGRANVHENGRFLLRAGKGSYMLSVSILSARKEKMLLGSLSVRVGSAGVVRTSLNIKEAA